MYRKLLVNAKCLIAQDKNRGSQIIFLHKNRCVVVFIAPACSRVRYRRPIFRPSVRLSTFMSTFDIYVKVSILINCKTKQPSNLA